MEYVYHDSDEEHDDHWYSHSSVNSDEFFDADGTQCHEEEMEHSEGGNEILESKDTGERQITYTHHGTNMFKRLKELRDSEELLDLTLKVNEDGTEDVILVHRCILAAHSPFVRAFLRNEDTNKVIDLSNWRKEVISTLIDWMYDGVLKIKSTNYYELLESSDYLCLNEVSQECAAYICDHLTSDNCCEAYIVLSHHQVQTFKDRVNKYILINFAEMLKGNGLMQLPTDDFLSFLKDDNLLLVNNYGFVVLPHEEEIILFNLLKTYINKNNLHDLWPHIIKDVLRFGLMDKIELQQLLLSEDWLGECKEKDLCLQYLKDIGALVASGEELTTFNHLSMKPRAGLQSIKYSWTHKFAYSSNFSEQGDPVCFDDVTSILNDLKTSGLPPLLYVTGMKLFTHTWDNHLVISTIEVTYNNGKTVLHGAVRNDLDIDEFVLEPGERIVKASGRTGWLLDCLQFETNTGRRLGPYGGSDGDSRSFNPKCPKSYLVGLKGCISMQGGYAYVRRLRFAWATAFSSEILSDFDHLDI